MRTSVVPSATSHSYGVSSGTPPKPSPQSMLRRGHATCTQHSTSAALKRASLAGEISLSSSVK
jgi:hypothetical protein